MIRYGWATFCVVGGMMVALPESGAQANAEALDGCPQGGTLRGEAPPDGRAQWCEAVDLFGVVRKNGPFRTWYKNGRLRTDGEFVDGKRHGTWTAYDDNGVVAAEQRYRFDQLLQERRREASSPPAPPPAPRAKTEPPRPYEIDRSREETSLRDYRPASRASDVEGLIFTEVTLSTQTGFNLFSTGLASEIAFGSFNLWGQWGITFVDTPADTWVEPLNPAFFAGYVLNRSAVQVPVQLRLGAGASIPVNGLSEDGDGPAGLAAVLATAPSRGLYDFWLYLPEFPVVALPLRADLELPFLVGRAELAPYFAIPTRSGVTTDLNLQAAFEAGTPILNGLTTGARMQLVTLGLTTGPQAFVSLEPYASGSYGAFFARAGFLFNIVTPEAFNFGEGLVWGANLRLGFTL